MIPHTVLEKLPTPCGSLKTFNICQVPYDDVDSAWPTLEKLLAAGPLEYADERHRAIVYSQLLNRTLVCWLIHDDKELVMAAMTEMRDNEYERAVYVVWGVGKRLNEFWPLVMSTLEDYAANLDATRVYIEGRLGWERWVKQYGYERVAVVFAKNVVRQRSN